MATVTVTEVTDPFCTWCWGTEPIRRRLAETYRTQVEFDFVMGGLVEDFETFRDAANGVSAPRDVAAHWEEASDQHGMPVDPDVWLETPPQSSYPASIAYEAAELLDERLARRYLRRLREALSLERRDISRDAVLVELAGAVGFDTATFEDALAGEEARDRFEADRAFVRQHRVTAFPSFRVEAHGDTTWATGFQPFDALRDAVTEVAPDLDERDPRPIPAFVRQYGRVATREVAEVYDLSVGHAMQVLRSLEAEGTLAARRVGNGYLWRVAADGSGQV